MDQPPASEDGSSTDAADQSADQAADGTGLLPDLSDLDERPVEEHVAVLEQAHDRLRQALDGSPGPAGPA